MAPEPESTAPKGPALYASYSGGEYFSDPQRHSEDAKFKADNFLKLFLRFTEQDTLPIRSFVDVGCGSGFKLIKYFSEFDTVGLDTGRTVKWLQKRYPVRRWQVSVLEEVFTKSADVVICADVIEHIPNPDLLMNFLSSIKTPKIFLSTPERNLVYEGHTGPPENLAHCGVEV